jgi:hypothetical protein
MSDEERSAKNPNKRDWISVAKEIIRENANKEIVRDQHQGELWLKTPSIMHGKPRDFFDKQDKRAMLTDPNESKKKNFFPKKRKSIQV